MYEIKSPITNNPKKIVRNVKRALKKCPNVIIDSSRVKGLRDDAIQHTLKNKVKDLPGLKKLIFINKRGQSKYYVDSLSENTKRGLREVYETYASGRCHNKKKWLKHKIFCGTFHYSCGMMITAEYKVKVQVSGKRHYHTYYRCSRKSKTIKCKEKLIREELLVARR